MNFTPYDPPPSRWYIAGKLLVLAGALGQAILGYICVSLAMVQFLSGYSAELSHLALVVTVTATQAPLAILFGWISLRLARVVVRQY